MTKEVEIEMRKVLRKGNGWCISVPAYFLKSKVLDPEKNYTVLLKENGNGGHTSLGMFGNLLVLRTIFL